MGSPPSFGTPSISECRKELQAALRSRSFRQAEQLSRLLEYVCEKVFLGEAEQLTEYTIAVDVLGKQQGFRETRDSSVRVDVHRLRKRLTAFYAQEGANQKIRIVIPSGSYVPEFQVCAAPQSEPLLPQYNPEFETILSAPEPAIQKQLPATAPRRDLRRYIVAIAVVIGLAAVAIVWFRPWVRPSDLDRFWKPVLDSSNTVLLCAGQRQFLGSSPEAGQVVSSDLPEVSKGPITLFQLYYMGSQNLSLPDVSTIGRLTGLLQTKGKNFRIRGQLSTDFADLRDGPVVLVGAFDNDWTMRLIGPRRFSFARDHDTFWIEDSQHPSRRDRAVNYRTPYLNLTEDYALISRTLDPTTDRMAVIVGGLTGYGTMAAGEFLTNPEYLEAMAKGAPKGWDHKNIQLVLATKVIHGNSGPPRILERHFW